MAQLAIDYGTDKVRLLGFEGAGKRLRVLSVVEVSLNGQAPPTTEGADAPGADDHAAEAIGQALDDAGMDTDPSAMAWPAGQAMFREFTLPFTGDEQIAKVVRFEAESHIPLDIDDVVTQHLVLRKTRDKAQILAVAVKKDDLLDRLDVLEPTGVDPMFVDVDVLALLHALDGAGVLAEHPRSVVISVQDHATYLLFLDEGRLIAVRSLRLGAHGIPRVPGGADPADVARAADGREAEVIAGRTTEFLGRLERETRRTLTGLPPVEGLPVVLLLGSGRAVPGLDASVGKLFPGARVELLDLLSRVEHELSAEDADRFGPDLGVALGVAYRLAGHDLTGVDFRRDECAYKRKFDQLKTPLIVLAFVVLLVVGLHGIDTFKRFQKIQREYGALLTNAQEQLQQQVGDNQEARKVWEGRPFGPEQMQAIAAAFDRRHNELALQLGRSAQIPAMPSALAVWMELSRVLLGNEEKLGRLWLRRIDIDVKARTPTLRVSGRMLDPSRYNELINLLSADPLFRNLRPGDVSPAPDGDFWDFGDTTADIDLDELARRKEG